MNKFQAASRKQKSERPDQLSLISELFFSDSDNSDDSKNFVGFTTSNSEDSDKLLDFQQKTDLNV